nr:reverse transcriptase domain-containing protein [Tanacetum cinerariifolium]
MHARASNSKLVEPLPEPERTLNQRLHRQNRRVPYDQRNNPPQHRRIFYPPILNINHFRHFLVTLENLYPMDGKPMWAADRVVALTPGFSITIPETANEFAIKDPFDRLLREIQAFSQYENESLTDAWLRMKEMLRNCHGHSLSKGNIIQIFYHGLNEITQNVLNAAAGAENMLVKVGKFTFPADFVILEMEEDRKVPLILGRPFLHTADAVIQVKQKQLNLGVGTKRMIFNIDSAMKHSYSNDDTCFSIDVIDEVLEEDFDALLDECSKILHSIEGTLLEEEIFAEFDEFMAMTADINFDSESDTEDPPFKKLTINTDYKIKTSLKEPPIYLELKPLLDKLEYHKKAFAWKTIDTPGICLSFCKHKIQLLDDKKPVVQKQRRLNPNMQEVVKKEIMKLLDTSIIYPIADSPWVSPIHYVPKKGGITVVTNENDELVPTRVVMGWRVCIDYRKLNEATAKDHFLLPFMDQMLERLVGINNSVSSMVFLGKCHFMVKERIVLRHKVSSAGLDVDNAKIDIKDFPKITRPLTKLLEKDTPFEFNDERQKAFELLKEKLTCDPVIVSPFWNLPFELMCDASDFAVGAVLEIKERKGTENVAADHLSRIEKDETSDDSEVDDYFHGETLMKIDTRNKPWKERTYADDIWENYKRVQGDNTYWWHDHGLEENERQESGLDLEEYDPPEVYVETFKGNGTRGHFNSYCFRLGVTSLVTP